VKGDYYCFLRKNNYQELFLFLSILICYNIMGNYVQKFYGEDEEEE